jgi:hypothetical protein
MELPPQETTVKTTAAIAGKNKGLRIADLRTAELRTDDLRTDDLGTDDPLMNALELEDMRIDTSK